MIKKKDKPEVVIENVTRNKPKNITTVKGLELFGVKLSDSSKKLGKTFDNGASVVVYIRLCEKCVKLILLLLLQCLTMFLSKIGFRGQLNKNKSMLRVTYPMILWSSLQIPGPIRATNNFKTFQGGEMRQSCWDRMKLGAVLNGNMIKVYFEQ